MALGASSVQVARLAMVQGTAPVLVGVILGIPGFIGVSQAVAGFLWGVTPTDPATLPRWRRSSLPSLRGELDSRARQRAWTLSRR